MGAVTILYFVFSFGPALNEKKKKKKGKGRRGSALITHRWRRRGLVRCRREGTFVKSHDRGEQLKDASDGFSLFVPVSCNRFCGPFQSVSSADVGRTRCWRGEQKVTVWSVTTTEQAGHSEPPPSRHRPQKEAFKWHRFHSVALSRFKSAGSPERIDFFPRRPIEVLRPQRLKESRGLGGRESGPLSGTFILCFALGRRAISHLCSLQVPTRPTRTEWMSLVGIVNTCKLRLVSFTQRR